MANENNAINEKDLENVNGGLKIFRMNYTSDEPVCPFCKKGKGVLKPMNTDNPTLKYECDYCYKEFEKN